MRLMKQWFWLIAVIWGFPQWGHALPCAALKSKKVNWRKGPGSDHPVTWIYYSPGWPVLIEKKKDHWYCVRDGEGTRGWVQGTMLSFQPTLLVTQDMTVLYNGPSTEKRILAYLKKGVIVRYLKHEGKVWYFVSVLTHKIKGWISAGAVWPCPPL